MRIVDAWRGDDGGLALRVRLENSSPKPMTIEPARAFTLVVAGDPAQAPASSRPLFETVAPGQAAEFELRFSAAREARALRLTLPSGGVHEWPLPAVP